MVGAARGARIAALVLVAGLMMASCAAVNEGAVASVGSNPDTRVHDHAPEDCNGHDVALAAVVVADPARALPSLAFSASRRATTRAAADDEQRSDSPRPVKAAGAPVGNGGGSAVAKLDPEFDLELALAAGRPPPPGLSSVREAERQRERQTQLDALRAHRDALGPGRFVAQIERMLLEPADETQWQAAAFAAGGLGLVELLPRVAAGLDLPGRRAAAARRALHAGLGIWFEDRAAFEPFARLADPRAVEPFQRQLGRLEAVHEQRLGELWRADPRAIESGLNHVSPALRRRAATALANAVGASTLDSAFAAPLLLGRARGEHDGRALCSQLDALTDVLQGSAPSSPLVNQSRELLQVLAREGPPDVLHCVARALAALPWSAVGAASADGPDLSEAFDALGALLARGGAEGGLDADVRIGLIEAVRGLALRSAYQPGMASSSGRRMAARLVAIVGDPIEAPAARRAAAAALSDLAGDDQIETLVGLLESARGDLPLRFALLGTLTRVAIDLEPADPRAAELARVGLALLAESDVDLRRRALALLGDGAIEGALDVAALARQVAGESNLELRGQMLSLLRRSAGASELPVLLQSDSLAGYAASSAARAAEVSDLVVALAAGDGELLFAGAQQLAESARIAANGTLAPLGCVVAHEPGRLVRALELVARLDPAAATALPERAHCAVVDWVHNLVAGSPRLGGTLSDGVAFMTRLLDVHLPAAALAGASGAPAVLERVRARVMAERERPGESAGRAFDSALASAGDGDLFRAILRDRARHQFARGDRVASLVDLRSLARMDLGAGALGSAAARLLDPTDLRRAYGLIAEGSADDASVAAEVFDFAQLAVTHPAWPLEPVDGRRLDLFTLGESALRSGDPARRVFARGQLAGLTPWMGLHDVAPDEEGKAWRGLVGETAWRNTLYFLAERLAVAAADDPTPADGDPNDPDEG